MMVSAKERLAKLQEAAKRMYGNKDGDFDFGYDDPLRRQLFPHWVMKNNERAVVRFLGDADEDVPIFWVERELIRLPFEGSSRDGNRRVSVQIPSLRMYGIKCPILEAVNPYWNDPDTKDKAKTYWPKKDYCFYGFVVESPEHMNRNDRADKNNYRIFNFSNMIFQQILNGIGLEDDDYTELEDVPTSIESGYDFLIRKRMKTVEQGREYGDYSTSKWLVKSPRPLSDEELRILEKRGLWNMNEIFMPPKPSDEVIELMWLLFETSLKNERYDYDIWGDVFPPGMIISEWPYKNKKAVRKALDKLKKRASTKKSRVIDDDDMDEDDEIVKNRKEDEDDDIPWGEESPMEKIARMKKTKSKTKSKIDNDDDDEEEGPPFDVDDDDEEEEITPATIIERLKKKSRK